MMMPRMSRATEHTKARTHILLRDFRWSRRNNMMSERKLPAEGAAAHLIVDRPVKLLRPSLHMNFSVLHICLDTVCMGREGVSAEPEDRRPTPAVEGLHRPQAEPGANQAWSIISHSASGLQTNIYLL